MYLYKSHAWERFLEESYHTLGIAGNDVVFPNFGKDDRPWKEFFQLAVKYGFHDGTEEKNPEGQVLNMFIGSWWRVIRNTIAVNPTLGVLAGWMHDYVIPRITPDVTCSERPNETMMEWWGPTEKREKWTMDWEFTSSDGTVYEVTAKGRERWEPPEDIITFLREQAQQRRLEKRKKVKRPRKRKRRKKVSKLRKERIAKVENLEPPEESEWLDA